MIQNELFVTAFIADIHFGSQPSESLYKQLEDRFLNIIEDKKIDLIVFGGDMFHSIITMNYSTSKYVLQFMDRVLDICSKNGIKYVRIIQGTMSHDNNQLNNFHIYENRSDVNFKIIKTLREEELVEGIKILYVPEEYMSNPEEYYSEYLSKEKYYDFIFGHGMFKEVAFIAKNQKSEVTMSKAPIFDSRTFINACKGPIYFGHIHTRTQIKEFINYPGSFSRFRHGEEEDKGWFLNIYDIKTNKFVQEFIVNDEAPKYITISIIMKEGLQPDEISDEIKKLLIDNEFVKVKIIINDNTDASYLISYLNELYRNNSSVKIEIENHYEFKQEAAVDKLMEQVSDKYDFLRDSSISHEEKIQKFIKMKHDKDIPLEVIRNVLNLN